MTTKAIAATTAIFLVGFSFWPTAAQAHRSGCHRWHSCPSDSGSYVCGDTGRCNYCPDNQYCKAGKPSASGAQDKATKAYPPQPLVSHVLTGRVVKITDGDTLYVLDANYEQHKIRLAGIDAPERKQAYGLASCKHLAAIVAAQQVTVDYRKRNTYGRIVRKVLLDGIDACIEQVKAGFAWHYKKYQHEQSPEDQRFYANAENKARNERLGLWRENDPNPPWEYRRLYR